MRSRAGTPGRARDPAEAARCEIARYAASSNARRNASNRADRGVIEQVHVGSAAKTAGASSLIGQLPRRTVGQRLGEVLRLDALGACERRDRRGDPRDASAAAT